MNHEIHIVNTGDTESNESLPKEIHETAKHEIFKDPVCGMTVKETSRLFIIIGGHGNLLNELFLCVLIG